MIDSLILNTVTRAAFPTVCVFSVYLLFAGHNAPGGGFVGGLVAGAALVLRYAGRGVPGVRAVLPEWLRFELLLGLGLLLASLTAIVPLLSGEALLTHHHYEWEVPIVGHVALGTALFFDTGVYLVVVGLVLGALEMLGTEPGTDDSGARDPRDAPEPAPTPAPDGPVMIGGDR
jgi:multicomponent Na+:H+ antiporter subunit A